MTAGKVVRVVYSRLKSTCNRWQQPFLETGEAKFNETGQNLDSDSENGKQTYKQRENVE